MLPRALVDARISLTSEVLALPDGRRLTEWLTATPDEALIEQSGIHIMVRGTDEVVVHLDDGADLDLLAPLLYGVTVRTLLLHADTFCLHASVVRHDGTVFAVAGHSGAGKSTTATALARFHGAALLVDDVVPARVVDGRPQVQVFDRPVHLTLEAAERLGVSLDDATVGDPRTAGQGRPAGDGVRRGTRRSDVARPRPTRRAVARGRRARTRRRDAACRRRCVEHQVTGAERLRWIVRLSNVTGHPTVRGGAPPTSNGRPTLADALSMVNIVRPEGEDTVTEVCEAVLATVDAEVEARSAHHC